MHLWCIAVLGRLRVERRAAWWLPSDIRGRVEGMLCGTNRDGVYRGCWRLRRLEMLEGVGDCPVQGHGSGLGGPAARAAIGGSLPCRGEGAASFGGGAGGPTRPRWASTSA